MRKSVEVHDHDEARKLDEQLAQEVKKKEVEKEAQRQQKEALKQQRDLSRHNDPTIAIDSRRDSTTSTDRREISEDEYVKEQQAMADEIERKAQIADDTSV